MTLKINKLMGNGTQKKAPVREIRWVGLYDKNCDKLYAPRQKVAITSISEYMKKKEL